MLGTLHDMKRQFEKTKRHKSLATRRMAKDIGLFPDPIDRRISVGAISPHSLDRAWLHVRLRGLGLGAGQVVGVVKSLVRFVLSLCSIAVASAIVALALWQMTKDTIYIQPISVPKTLVDVGYSPDVAARRLQDAMNNVEQLANTSFRMPDFGEASAAPDVIVPSLGVSVQALLYYTYAFFGIDRHKSISGEVIFDDQSVSLLLRIEGRVIFNKTVKNRSGRGIEEVADLTSDGARSVIEYVRPYISAAALYHDSPSLSLERANHLIAVLPDDAEDVAWLKTLKAMILFQQGNAGRAEKILRAVIEERPDFAVAHQDLAIVMEAGGRYGEAIDELAIALRLRPNSKFFREQMASALIRSGKFDEAIDAGRKAGALDPGSANIKYLIGLAMQESVSDKMPEEMRRKRLEDACSYFAEASRVGPDNEQYLDAMRNVYMHYYSEKHCVPD